MMFSEGQLPDHALFLRMIFWRKPVCTFPDHAFVGQKMSRLLLESDSRMTQDRWRARTCMSIR
jgi:hypothetical protein